MLPVVVCGLFAVCISFLCVKWLRRSHIRVNCWFCNLNSSVPLNLSNKWICQHCDQYNGFHKDGDYNCDFTAFSGEASNTVKKYCAQTDNTHSSFDNGLCSDCNYSQEKKIALLSSFQPINDNNYDKEIENFRENLERAYRLCPACEIVLEETLSQKKTLILASNLNVTGSKAGLRSQGFFKILAMKIVSVLTSTLALTLALSLTYPLYSSLLASTEPLEKTIHHYSPPFSYSSSRLSPFQSIQRFCPVMTSNDPSGVPESKNILDILEFNILPLALGLLSLQLISSCLFSHNWILLLLCFCQVLVSLLQFSKYERLAYIQILVSWAVVVLSVLGTRNKRARSVVSIRRLGSTCDKSKQQETSILNKAVGENNVKTASVCAFPHSVQESSLANTVHSAPARVALTPMSLPNYLTLPTRSPAHQERPPLNIVLPTQPLVEPSCRLDDPSPGLPYEQQSSASQEDARSDASVDSAFSNADSAILDSADAVGSAFSSSSECFKDEAQDTEVHSLINSLTLGSCQKMKKKGHAFTTQRYGRNKMSPTLLKPSKLADALSDSWNSSLWSGRSEVKLGAASAFVPVDKSTNSRSISPTGSVHSQITQSSLPSESSVISPMTASWNGPTTVQSGLPISVSSQMPFAALGGPTLFANPQFPHVVYTSFGLNHQPFSPLWNPSAFTMSSQSPSVFGTSSAGRQRRPPHLKNFSTRPSANMFEIESDDDADLSSLSQNSHYKNLSANLSSSFVDSVWQSRAVIIYTTACYAAVGCAILSFYHKDKIFDFLSAIPFF